MLENDGKGNNDEANEGFEHATVVTVVTIAVVGPLLPSPLIQNKTADESFC